MWRLRRVIRNLWTRTAKESPPPRSPFCGGMGHTPCMSVSTVWWGCVAVGSRPGVGLRLLCGLGVPGVTLGLCCCRAVRWCFCCGSLSLLSRLLVLLCVVALGCSVPGRVWSCVGGVGCSWSHVRLWVAGVRASVGADGGEVWCVWPGGVLWPCGSSRRGFGVFPCGRGVSRRLGAFLWCCCWCWWMVWVWGRAPGVCPAPWVVTVGLLDPPCVGWPRVSARGLPLFRRSLRWCFGSLGRLLASRRWRR